MATLRTLPKPLVRRPDEIDNLEYLREFGQSVESTRLDVADLQRRTALLEGVSAYGNVVMTRNEWVVNGRPLLRFGQPISEPMKNVSVLSGGVGLKLELEGLWRLDCYTWAASTIYTGHPFAQIEVEIKTPASMGGSTFTKPFKVDTDDGSVGGAMSFVAEEPGYEIRVYAQTGRWRRMLGGTRYSYLSVNRWNPEKTTAGTPEVPDGPGQPT